MIIKYKSYTGVLIHMEQIKEDIFYFVIRDIDDVSISFKTHVKEIKIVNCLGNADILSEVQK